MMSSYSSSISLSLSLSLLPHNLCVLSTSCSYSAQYATVKLGKDHSGFWAMTFFRGVVGTGAALITALLSRKRQGSLFGAHTGNIKWLLLRGVLGAITIISAFLAVTVRE